jgi:rhodanese-related sulfurtransferase
MTADPIDLPIEEFLAARAAGAAFTLVDCREGWECELVRLPGALHIALGQLASRADEVPSERPVVVYCHHGVRSRHGAALLREAGLVNARSLAGGIDRWSLTVDPTLPRY